MDLPREVPVMTLPSAILFPQALLPLYIFEPRYRRMLSDALSSHRMFSVAMQRPGRTRETPCSVDGLTVKVLELVSERLEQGFELPLHVLKKLGQLDDLDTDELPPDFALKQGIEILAKLNNPDQIADLVSCTLLSSPMERQLLLETIDLEVRLKHLIHFLMSEIRHQQKNKNK